MFTQEEIDAVARKRDMLDEKHSAMVIANSEALKLDNLSARVRTDSADSEEALAEIVEIAKENLKFGVAMWDRMV